MFRNLKPTFFASGFQSPEGPSFDRKGNLHIVDWDAGKIYRINPIGKVTKIFDTFGSPCGSKFHKDGRLFVADKKRGILLVDTDGKIHIVASGFSGKPFLGLNDLVFSSKGDLYFSDPEGSDPQNPIGRVFLLKSENLIKCFAEGLQYPNGLVLSDDGRTLYLAETYQNRILSYELAKDGSPLSSQVFAQLEGGLGPDGMAFDEEGNLYVSHFGKGVVAVINPLGQVIAEIDTIGKKPTNLAFWGTKLFVTEVENGCVISLNIGIRGQILYGLR